MPTETIGPAASPALTLSAPERELLARLRASEGAQEESELAERSGWTSDTVRGTLERLRSKHLVLSEEEHWEERRLTRRGSEALQKGLPERRLLRALVEQGGSLAADAAGTAGIDAEEQKAAIGYLRRHGYLADGVPFRLAPSAPPPSERFSEESSLEAIARGEPVPDEDFGRLRRRGLAEGIPRSRRRWRASPEGRELPLAEPGAPTLGALTPALLKSGGWKEASFRPYDVRADVPYLVGARGHPYVEWIRQFQEILVGLGFEEWEGPLLESEFWNSDVLFMPQEHPARSIHDVLSVSGATPRLPPPELLQRVAAVHEGRPLPGESEPLSAGWRTPYREDIARRAVLRSQTTAVSARYLAAHPEAPFRIYCLDRNFRREEIDASHHVEFGQCEGILGEEGTSLRDLIGIFRALAEAIGIRELKLRPSYFPFTEPSIEGYVRHPRLGWMEVFPGGMFRPEVLRPLGVKVPVAAWGIGVTRLAMVALGVSDIRELYLDDLARLEGRE